MERVGVGARRRIGVGYATLKSWEVPCRQYPKLNRYVTDEQRSRRPIFNATLRAAASWLFFRVARSARMDQIWALRSRLEKQPTDLRRHHHYMRDGTLVRG